VQREGIALSKQDDIIIDIKKMTFYRGERKIFDNASMAIRRGKITAILGPSGTGKTTLLHLIGGLLLADKGTVTVFDENISDLSLGQLYRLRRRMALLFQSGALFTDLNVFDNVAFPLQEHTHLPADMIRDIVLMKLEAVGLRGAHELMPNELSGGMSRRVALARAIALDPELMLYDEPFTGQDPISMGVLVKLIHSLNEVLQLTSVIVSHDVKEVLSIADYVYIIASGKVIGEGTPTDIRHNKSEQVAQFVYGKPDGPVPFHYPAPEIEKDFLGGHDG